MLNDLLERGAKNCGFDLHWHSDGKLAITQKQLERFAVFVVEDCAAIADTRAMRCEEKVAGAEDEDESIELRSLAWQFSVLAAEIRERSNK